MEDFKNNGIIQVVQSTFEMSAMSDIENGFLRENLGEQKWMCFSDYSLNDKRKPNDVVSFTLVPHIYNFDDVSLLIKSVAKVDVKKTRKVSNEFIDFLKNFPLLNISFILKNRKRLAYGENDFKTILFDSFKDLADLCDVWISNRPKMKENYLDMKRKYTCVMEHISNNKKLNLIADMSLVTMLGSYISGIVVEKCKPSILGWFSDRDAINEICHGVSMDLFRSNLWELTRYSGEFAFAAANSKSNAFYEEFVRIPDYIAGTLADLNFTDDTFTSDKFKTIYTDYMANNVRNNFVFEIDFNNNGNYSCRRLTIVKL